MLAWLHAEWNRPNRADHYAMKTCETIDGLFRKSDMNDYRVTFKDKLPAFKPDDLPPGIRPMTKEDIEKVQRHWRRQEAEKVARQIEERNEARRGR